MSLWFYVWIVTSIIFGIYIFRDYLKSPKYFKVRLWDYNKAVDIKDVEEKLIPAKDWKTHLMVISQWLFVTLFLGFVLFIFSEDSYLPEIIVCADEKYAEHYAKENQDEVNTFLSMKQKFKNEDGDYQMSIILCEETYTMYKDEFIKKYK